MLPLGPAGSTQTSPQHGRTSAPGYAFGPFLLDTRSNHLFRDNEPVAMPARHMAVLRALVAAAGKVVSKDHLIEVGWGRAVSDGSLAKVVAAIRRTLDPDQPDRYIATSAGEGYQFVAVVTIVEPKKVDTDIFSLLAPDRIWGEGMAALESLSVPQLKMARGLLEGLLTSHPHVVRFHVAQAMICVFLYESTRADTQPDTEALKRAVAAVNEAARLGPDLVEVSATLGFVLDRDGQHDLALAASRRATRLDPTNWMHQVRLAELSWGQERHAAVRETLLLNPGLAIAHLFGATLWVARRAHDEARRMVDAGVKAMEAEVNASARFMAVALHYLKGLLCISKGHLDEALIALQREVNLESRAHVYGRECCANAYYAIGACHLLMGNLTAARAAFLEALARVAHHPLALAGIRILEKREAAKPPSRHGSVPTSPQATPSSLAFEHEMASAALLVDDGDVEGAVGVLLSALKAAPPGNAGWWIALDPLLRVWEHPDQWEPVLELVAVRAR